MIAKYLKILKGKGKCVGFFEVYKIYLLKWIWGLKDCVYEFDKSLKLFEYISFGVFNHI